MEYNRRKVEEHVRTFNRLIKEEKLFDPTTAAGHPAFPRKNTRWSVMWAFDHALLEGVRIGRTTWVAPPGQLVSLASGRYLANAIEDGYLLSAAGAAAVIGAYRELIAYWIDNNILDGIVIGVPGIRATRYAYADAVEPLRNAYVGDKQVEAADR